MSALFSVTQRKHHSEVKSIEMFSFNNKTMSACSSELGTTQIDEENENFAILQLQITENASPGGFSASKQKVEMTFSNHTKMYNLCL